MEGFRVHVLTRIAPRMTGDHVHGYMAAELPGQPFGDQAHLIDHAVHMIERRVRPRCSTRGLTTLTTVRPGTHDITVMVATQDPRPLTACGATLEVRAMAVCGNGSQGDTATRHAERGCSGGAVADQNAPCLSKS